MKNILILLLLLGFGFQLEALPLRTKSFKGDIEEDGYRRIKNNSGKWWLIDKDGKVASYPFSYIGELSCGYRAVVFQDHDAGYIKGNVVQPIRFVVSTSFKDNKAYVLLKNGNLNVIDTSMNFLYPDEKNDFLKSEFKKSLGFK